MSTTVTVRGSAHGITTYTRPSAGCYRAFIDVPGWRAPLGCRHPHTSRKGAQACAGRMARRVLDMRAGVARYLEAS